MKVAQLPNGHVLGFPDDAEDPHMDAAVQGYMASRGEIPPPVDPTTAMLDSLQQGFSQALGQITQSLQTQIAEMQQANERREQVFLQQLDQMQQANERREQGVLQQLEQMLQTLTAPKRIAYDGAGRPVGLIVGN